MHSVQSLSPADFGDRQSGDHVKLVFPNDCDHIVKWLAHRVQRAEEKINHALVLGGAQGIGKDTLLEPVKRSVGPWNTFEISPQHLLGRFNGFAKAVILRINEARDLGEMNRYQFYDHAKAYTATPPDPSFNRGGKPLTSLPSVLKDPAAFLDRSSKTSRGAA